MGTLLGLPAERQRQLAAALADLALPFTDLPHADETNSLGCLVVVLRRGGELKEVERARHELFEGAQLWETEEPVGVAWYSHRARVAWIRAADAALTGRRDGVLNTSLVLNDLLDQADTDLGGGTLARQLREELADGDPNLDALRGEMRESSNASRRRSAALRPQPRVGTSARTAAYPMQSGLGAPSA